MSTSLTAPPSAHSRASEALVSEGSDQERIYQGWLPVVKVGRLTRLRQRDLEALVSEGTATVDRR